jgi:hypothetical protein
MRGDASVSVSTSGPRRGVAPSFCPRADDIFIASYPRSGTTWLQMIVWHLVTAGDVSFDHISQVIPFLEGMAQQPRNGDGLPSPRIFKTHLPFQTVATWPGKFIYVARDGRDVLISCFHFERVYFGSTEPFDAFFERFVTGHVLYGSWFSHVAAWTAHAGDSNLLCLTYEGLTMDFEASVRKAASFLQVTVEPERIRELQRRCSFASMRAIEQKFDAGVGRSLETGRRHQAHAAGPGSFVRQGRVGGWRDVLTAAQQSRFAALTTQVD